MIVLLAVALAASNAEPKEAPEHATLCGWVYSSNPADPNAWIEIRKGPFPSSERIGDLGFSTRRVRDHVRQFHGHRVLASAVVVRHGQTTLYYVTAVDSIRVVPLVAQPENPQ